MRNPGATIRPSPLPALRYLRKCAKSCGHDARATKPLTLEISPRAVKPKKLNLPFR
jgi:hypothetical protein